MNGVRGTVMGLGIEGITGVTISDGDGATVASGSFRRPTVVHRDEWGVVLTATEWADSKNGTLRVSMSREDVEALINELQSV